MSKEGGNVESHSQNLFRDDIIKKVISCTNTVICLATELAITDVKDNV